MSSHITVLGKEKTRSTNIKEKHKCGLGFEKRKSFTQGDRIYIDMGDSAITSIGVNKNELESFIKFLNRVTLKLETMKNEG